MKTLPECKDKIAKKEGYRNWSVMEASSSVSYTCLLECLEAAAELYASQFIEPYSPTVKESETGANWQKERENAELTRTNAQLDEMVTKYNELSKKYADLYSKYYGK